MTQQTFTGKTGDGFASLGATRIVLDVEVVITGITSAKVRRNQIVNSTQKVQYAGSYGLMFDGAHGNLVVSWHPVMWDHQDFPEFAGLGATHLFWSFRPGVTGNLVVTY